MKPREWTYIILVLVGSAESKLTVNNSGPVLLDTPIWFEAHLSDYEEGTTLVWEWSDDLWHKDYVYVNGPRAGWNITYDEMTYLDYTGFHTVMLVVKKKFGPIWLPMDEASSYFNLTEYLTGNLNVYQPNVTFPSPSDIATANKTNITAVIYDPHDWIKKRTEVANFFWVINNKIHATCKTPSLIINITEPGDYNIRVIVYLNIMDHLITTTTSTTTTTTTTTTTPAPTPQPSNHTTTTAKPTTTTTKPTTTTTKPTTTTTSEPPTPNHRGWRCDGYWPQEDPTNILSLSHLKIGYFQSVFTAREPINKVNVTGNTWLKHGELVNLTIQCSGSGPWGYCHRIYRGVYNKTGTETCKGDLTMTNDCNFPVIYYFRETGTHTYLLIISNEISTVIKPIPINIYNVDRKPQLSYIIIPVSCSLVVIIMIVFGISYFIQTRNRYSVEVADFDFGASEEPEYKTMFLQLKDALSQALRGSDTDEEEDKWRASRHVVEQPRILEEED